jgi:hypothetical protein
MIEGLVLLDEMILYVAFHLHSYGLFQLKACYDWLVSLDLVLEGLAKFAGLNFELCCDYDLQHVEGSQETISG